jgi:putative ABC transport system permease protein
LDSGFEIAGRPSPSPEQRPQGLVTRVDPSYFSTMEIPLLRGRVFTPQDTAATNSVIISDALARRYFPDQEPVGQRLLLGRQKREMQILGVVGDVKHNNLRSDTRPEFYLPLARFTSGAVGLIVRVEADPRAMLAALQQRVWSVDANLAGNLATPVETVLYSSLAPARIAAQLLGAFALATLLLGLVGVYGVMSYSVRQRTRELGIRLALGASQGGIARLVLGEAVVVAAAGVLAGIAGSLLLTRYMGTLLFGVTAFDVPTYLVAAVAVPATALLAAYVPARRAMRVDPAASLRE